MKLTDDKITLLIELLASTDCIFSTLRVYKPTVHLLDRKQIVAVMERRDGFAVFGLNELGGGSAAQRKAVERAISGLKSDGLVSVFIRAGRRVGCRLTERGDNIARWFAATAMYHEAWPLIRRLEVLAKHGVCMDEEMVSELDLALMDEGKATAEFWEVHDRVLVLKMRGLVEESFNGYGHCFFNLTTEGREALQGPAPQKPEDLPKYKNFSDAYEELLNRNLAARENWQPIHKNEVYIPLSCGIGPEKCWRDLDPKVIAELRAST